MNDQGRTDMNGRFHCLVDGTKSRVGIIISDCIFRATKLEKRDGDQMMTLIPCHGTLPTEHFTPFLGISGDLPRRVPNATSSKWEPNVAKPPSRARGIP